MPTFLKLVTIYGHKVTLYSYDVSTWASDQLDLDRYLVRIRMNKCNVAGHFESISHDEDAIKRVAITLRQRQRKSHMGIKANRMSTIKRHGSRVRLPRKQLQLMQGVALEAM